jgi:hypothetical protein
MTNLFKLNPARRGDSGRGSHRLRGKPLAATCAVLGLVAVAAAACGNNGGSSSSSGGKTTLTELDDYPAGLPQYAAYQWLFNTYEKTHPNVKIARQSVSGTEILPKMLSEAQTHTLPDLAVPTIRTCPTSRLPGSSSTSAPTWPSGASGTAT